MLCPQPTLGNLRDCVIRFFYGFIENLHLSHHLMARIPAGSSFNLILAYAENYSDLKTKATLS